MHGTIDQTHNLDADGNPAGGHTEGRGFRIEWQNGALMVNGERHEPTGAFVEDVVQAVIGRIESYQGTKFRCRENALAITHLQEAGHWLNHRAADREARGVEGTHDA